MRIVKRNRKKLGVLLTVVMLLCIICPMALADSVAERSIVLQTDAVGNILFDEDGIIANMNELGIDKTVQYSLMRKITNGEMLDSNNPEKLKEIAHLLRVSPQDPRVEHTFQDGSKIVLELTVIKRIVSEVTYLVSGSDALTAASYRADVMLDKDWPSSRILRVYDRRITVYGGSFQNVDLSIIRAQETSTQPAHARLAFDYTILNLGSFSKWLDLAVQNGQFFVYYW